MSPLSNAISKFIQNPRQNVTKIIPYLKSRSQPYLRAFYEYLGLEGRSKPYPGHDKLLEFINFRDGFFVVCGGNDGYGFDPTYYLEKFKGWTGIIIEPLPSVAKICQKNRPSSTVFPVALVAHDFKGSEIELYNCNFMSVTEKTSYDIKQWVSSGEKAQNIKTEKISVPAVTLDSILDKGNFNKTIDLLVIDVEGSEEEVLKGFDLAKHKPTNILIEIHNESAKAALEKILLDHYQVLAKITEADYLYQRKT